MWKPTISIKMYRKTIILPHQPEQVHPLCPKLHWTSWMPLIRASLAAQGITGELQDIILASWRDGTRKQYCTYITAWLKYCSDCNISQVNPKLQQVLDFLTLQSKRVGYSAVATARSALSSFIKVDGVKGGDHPLVSRFMTGLFNQKPALPRYSETWDPQIVLNHLKTFPSIDDMSLKQLTLKLVTLMALLSAQRAQTLKSLSLEEMSTLLGKYVFPISSVLKQTTAKGGQNIHLLPITFHSYSVGQKTLYRGATFRLSSKNSSSQERDKAVAYLPCWTSWTSFKGHNITLDKKKPWRKRELILRFSNPTALGMPLPQQLKHWMSLFRS